MARTNLLEVHREFNSRLGSLGSVVIAGGAVRDHLMLREPKDYDIFVLRHSTEVNRKSRVLEALKDLPVIKPLLGHDYEPYLVITVEFMGSQVQCMLNPADSMDELIDTFDWSCCLFGYNGSVIQARTPINSIKPGGELTLQKCTFPLSTLRRGFRFSERFQMNIAKETLLSLCQQVVNLKALAGPAGATPDMPSLAANVLVED